MAADRQTAVGAFVLGGTVLALSAIVLFGKFNIFGTTTRAVVVFQDSISGLSIGAPVTFRGVRVGAVDSIVIQFDPTTRTAYIPVTVQLEPDRVRVSRGGNSDVVDLSRLIARGLRAELNTQSFVTGQSEGRPRLRCGLAGGPACGPHRPARNPDAAIHDPARQGAAQPIAPTRTGGQCRRHAAEPAGRCRRS